MVKIGDRVVWLDSKLAGIPCGAPGCLQRHRFGVVRAIESWGVMVKFPKHPCTIQIPQTMVMRKAEWLLSSALKGLGSKA